MHRPALALVFTASLVAALALPVSVSASATAAPAAPTRVVPADEALYGISCDWAVLPDMLHVFALDPDTAVGPLIGTTTRIGNSYFCARGIGWDRVADSCSVYTMAHEPDMLGALVRTNLITGASVVIAPITSDGVEVRASGFAIDGSGVAWVTSRDTLNTVDLATGILTPVGPITGASVNALAWNASTGSLVAASDKALFSLDRATGAATLLLDLTSSLSGTFIEGFTVDTAGTFWLTVRETSTVPLELSEAISVLWSVSGGVPQVEGTILVDGAKLNTLALTSIPQQACALPTLALPPGSEPVVPTLAATGLEDATPILLPVAAFALALGALLVSSARRRPSAGGRRRGSRRVAR